MSSKKYGVSKKTFIKQDIIILSFLLCVIIIIVVIIIILNNRKNRQIESFNTYTLHRMSGRIKNAFNMFKSTEAYDVNNIYHKDKIENLNKYFIEQTFHNKENIDDYKIKSNTGTLLYETEGIWDFNESNFQLVSTAGQGIFIEEISTNRFFFTIENIKISFYYKKTKILGNILIEDGSDSINIYMIKNKKYTNFYTSDKKRVAYAKTITSNNINNINELVIAKNYNKYNTIFMIIFIIYLQIYKYHTKLNDEFL